MTTLLTSTSQWSRDHQEPSRFTTSRGRFCRSVGQSASFRQPPRTPAAAWQLLLRKLLLLCGAVACSCISGYFSAGGSLLFVSSSSCSRREALSIGPVAGATSATLFSSAAAQSPASAALLDFLAGESEPTTIMDAFKVTAPAGFAILEQSAGQVAWRGDKVQPMEGMVAAAQLTKATSLAELLGPNVTEAGEQVAAKFKGNPFLVNATAEDPTGQGLDVYQFDIVTNRFREVSMYALIKRGGQNVLCFVSLKTPAQLFLDSFANKEDSFRQSLASFSPLEPQPNKAP